MTVENNVFGRKCVRNRERSYSFGRSLASDEVYSQILGSAYDLSTRYGIPDLKSGDIRTEGVTKVIFACFTEHVSLYLHNKYSYIPEAKLIQHSV